MTRLITEEGKDDLLSRGFSRRQMLRTAVLMGGASALAGFSPELAWAQDDDVKAEHTHAKIRIGQNECWTGPFAVGVAAGSAILSRSNRYAPDDQRGDFIRTQLAAGNILEQTEIARFAMISAIVFLEMQGAAFWATRVNGQVASFNSVALKILRLVDDLTG